ncbi:MAG: SMC-Scp complex subunit ScpB [bacterium]|nr:SMC-Scp complex subunit ScpB [bacterium]MDZ4299421.1 SMC-Scp complex subunit ScpB [Candidatus Sungbacteria bacterium]
MNESQEKNSTALLEALLFAHGGEISFACLGELAGMTADEAATGVHLLAQEYREGRRGLTVIQHQGGCALGTSGEYAEQVGVVGRKEFSEELSRASLETLALIAYRGPLTRTEVEEVRGVQSSSILRNLLLRGLIERTGESRGEMAHRYRVTTDFLAHIGLGSLEELPGFSALRADAGEVLAAVAAAAGAEREVS